MRLVMASAILVFDAKRAAPRLFAAGTVITDVMKGFLRSAQW